MKTHLAVLTALLWGILSAQVELNYSYEMKYGTGKEVRGQASSNPYTTDYSYIENLLDINTYFMDNIYAYTQLEFSNPPVYGYNRTGIDSILNTFYMEFSHDRFNVKLGDLYELYGRGLGLYTLQDQNIDYDNSIKGLTLNYFLKENLRASTLIGTGEYAFRSNPANRKTDYQFDTNVSLVSIDYENQFIGYFQVIYMTQQSYFSSKKIYDGYDIITDICVNQYNDVGEELNARPGTCFEGLGENPNTINIKNYNLSWNYFIGSIDLYIDKSWIYYDKIYGNEVFGSRFYTSIYTEVLGTGLTYEYKNYYTPYLLKSISNPPICYREGNSILASRNAHSMNFGNEIGHQIDLNRNLIGNMNIAANLSLSNRHQMDDMESIGLLDILSMKDEDEMYDYYPFRQFYLEMNGWALNERLYYKVGMDHFAEYFDGKNTNAFTIPTHWVWKLSSESALTIYLETQKKHVKRVTPGEYTNNYLSVCYSYLGKWIVTGFYDQEIKDSNSNEWIGADLSYKINTETQVSLFYGSQKGGLVCANGICAEQPGFEDGFKVTFRSLF